MVEIDVWKHGVVVAKAKVDTQDMHFGDHKWFLAKDKYAYRKSGPATNRVAHFLHREIMGNPPGMLVDHRNGDELDCQRDNLRVTDRAGNAQNRRGANARSRSGVRGVSILPSGKYEARVTHEGKNYRVGPFADLVSAERAAIAKRQEFRFLTGAEDPAASPVAS